METYRKELERMNPRDQKYVDWMIKETSAVMHLSNGGILPIEKPRIETEFCYGYSTCGQGMSLDEASGMADNARRSENHFIESNLHGINKEIQMLERFNVNDLWSNKDFPVIYKKHNRSEMIYGIVFVDAWQYNVEGDGINDGHTQYYKMSIEDIKKYLELVKIEKVKFEKRLRTYLKRYGTKKLRAWTYWVDE